MFSLGNSTSFGQDFKEGDVIFHTSTSSQSQAIQLVTKSKFSHCGIIVLKDGKLVVLEAVQPVKFTSLETWIKRGEAGKYVVKRLIDRQKFLTPAVLSQMNEVGNSFLGKNYDMNFAWSNDEMYCSELIWKIYKIAVGIELGELQILREFDLSDKIVRQKIEERYGKEIPLEESVISPAAIYDCLLLETVIAN